MKVYLQGSIKRKESYFLMIKQTNSQGNTWGSTLKFASKSKAGFCGIFVCGIFLGIALICYIVMSLVGN